MRCWRGYLSGASLKTICIWSSWCHCHPSISCFTKIQISLAFLVPTYPGDLENRPLYGLLSALLSSVTVTFAIMISALLSFGSDVCNIMISALLSSLTVTQPIKISAILLFNNDIHNTMTLALLLLDIRLGRSWLESLLTECKHNQGVTVSAYTVLVLTATSRKQQDSGTLVVTVLCSKMQGWETRLQHTNTEIHAAHAGHVSLRCNCQKLDFKICF